MIPEVRQDQREGSPTFGASAHKLPETSPHYLAGRQEWGYMTSDNGGGFASDAQVADWTVMTGEE